MELLNSIEECLQWRAAQKGSVGFIPTMGALHEGHLSLVRLAKQCCTNTVVSIFINPKQFAENEDLGSYPKTLDSDIQNLERLNVDVLFLPNENEMYVKLDSVIIPNSDLFEKLEGNSRPHFFFGVTQIVAKLFNVIKPTHAFFGEKDAQQLIIIKEMISKMDYKIDLISCSTVRDKNGLALSSRNQYLSINDLVDASHFSKTLLKIKEAVSGGELRSLVLKNQFEENLLKSEKFRLDYISIASKKTLNEIDVVAGNVLISAAVFFNEVRLIDNFIYQSST